MYFHADNSIQDAELLHRLQSLQIRVICFKVLLDCVSSFDISPMLPSTSATAASDSSSSTASQTLSTTAAHAVSSSSSSSSSPSAAAAASMMTVTPIADNVQMSDDSAVAFIKPLTRTRSAQQTNPKSDYSSTAASRTQLKTRELFDSLIR